MITNYKLLHVNKLQITNHSMDHDAKSILHLAFQPRPPPSRKYQVLHPELLRSSKSSKPSFTSASCENNVTIAVIMINLAMGGPPGPCLVLAIEPTLHNVTPILDNRNIQRILGKILFSKSFPDIRF